MQIGTILTLKAAWMLKRAEDAEAGQRCTVMGGSTEGIEERPSDSIASQPREATPGINLLLLLYGLIFKLLDSSHSSSGKTGSSCFTALQARGSCLPS